MKFIITLLCFLVLLGCSGESVSEESRSKETASKESVMFGLFGKKEEEKYVISSPLEGVLVKDGKPMANTKIIRRLRWNGNEEGNVDEFFTDNKGYFSIPTHEEILTLNTMTQFVGSITLFAHEEIDENFFWYSPKTDGELYSDTGGTLEGMICDLNNEEKRIDVTSHGVLTKCLWNNMPVE